MAKLNINLNAIGKYAKKGCELTAKGIIAVLSFMTVKDALDMMTYSGDIEDDVRCRHYVGYGDAIGAIMNSNMMSSYKKQAVALVPDSGSEELYRAIISIVKSNMMESYKVESIESICKNK